MDPAMPEPRALPPLKLAILPIALSLKVGFITSVLLVTARVFSTVLLDNSVIESANIMPPGVLTGAPPGPNTVPGGNGDTVDVKLGTP